LRPKPVPPQDSYLLASRALGDTLLLVEQPAHVATTSARLMRLAPAVALRTASWGSSWWTSSRRFCSKLQNRLWLASHDKPRPLCTRAGPVPGNVLAVQHVTHQHSCRILRATVVLRDNCYTEYNRTMPEASVPPPTMGLTIARRAAHSSQSPTRPGRPAH
jgi:hypothetical protein